MSVRLSVSSDTYLVIHKAPGASIDVAGVYIYGCFGPLRVLIIVKMGAVATQSFN